MLFSPYYRVYGKFHEKMYNKHLYEDSINGVGVNFSLASNVLRFEVLYTFGGCYFDVNDIFPRLTMSQLQPQFGFYCQLSGRENDSINADVLASVPQGTLINRSEVY